MNFFRKLFGRTSRKSTSFNRYYGNVIHTGVGYPTADEARRDIANTQRTAHPFGWPM